MKGTRLASAAAERRNHSHRAWQPLYAGAPRSTRWGLRRARAAHDGRAEITGVDADNETREFVYSHAPTPGPKAAKPWPRV